MDSMDAVNAKEQVFRQKFEAYTKECTTLKDATYYALKDAILLSLFENEIAENQIAAILGISRTPIREAMLQLSRDGLLEISHGKKARILPLTQQDIDDISIILENLHSLSLTLCVRNATDEDIHQMEETVALISFYTGRKDLRHLTECNTRFHVQIAQASKNKWLADIVERLLSYTLVYRQYAVSRPGRMEVACQEHIEILDVICQRDVKKADQLIHAHVRRAFDIT